MGVYPITKTYGAQHGYSVNIFPAQGILELRASYFSSHTYNKVSTWNCLLVYVIMADLLSCFILERWSLWLQLQSDCITWRTVEGSSLEQDLYSCPILGPKRDYLWSQLHGGNNWSTCNWQHVFRFRLDAVFSVGVAKTWGHLSSWDATSRQEWLQTGIFPTICTAGVTIFWIILMINFQNYPLVTEDVHMVLHTHGAKLKPMSLSDAFRQGYVFHVTYERLVLRTAYGQVDSVATEVNVH